MKINNLNFKIRLYYFIVYSALACYYPFITVYLQQKHLSYSQIGFIFAVTSLISVFFQPLWGFATDKYFYKRYTLMLTMLLSGIFIISLEFAWNFLSILAAVMVFMVFLSPVTSISDAYCYELIESNKSLQYGKIRLMGSFGYAVGALLLGYAVKRAGIGSLFFIYFLLIILAVLIIQTIKSKGKTKHQSFNLSDISQLFGNKKFIIISISALIVNAAMSGNGNYINVLIQKTGGDVTKLGLLWFIVAMSELPALFFGNKILKKFGVINIYIYGLALYAIRFFLDSICTDYRIALAIQILQGITYTLYIMSTLQYVYDSVPDKSKTTAVTTFNSISSGVGGFIGNIAGGIIIQYLGIFAMYKASVVICILAIITVLPLLKKRQAA